MPRRKYKDLTGAMAVSFVVGLMLLWFWGVGYVNCAAHIGGYNCFPFVLWR